MDSDSQGPRRGRVCRHRRDVRAQGPARESQARRGLGMLTRLVEVSLRYKFLVLLAALFVVVLGVRAVRLIPIDAFPDVTPVHVQVFTESAGLSPEEVEKIVTVPVESAIAGLPKVELIRSLSIFGLSYVTIFFEDGTDVFFARQLVLERLAEAKERIPEGFG